MSINDQMGWHARWQDLGEWRDRTILEAARLLNKAGVASLADFEAALPQAGMIGSMWDPASYAAAPVDRAMRHHAQESVTNLLARAAAELSDIGGDLAAIADGVREAADTLPWPADREAPIPPETPSPAPAAPVTREPEPPPETGTFTRLARTLGSAGTMALGTVAQLGESAGRTLMDRTGLDDRLRAAARARIATRWLGTRHPGTLRPATGAEPDPLLAAIIALVDHTSILARNA